jgi:sacsin
MAWPPGLVDMGTKCDLAAALDIRPIGDAWFCSYTKRLLSSGTLSLSSPLQQVLGWTSPLDVLTLAKQLKELAKVYTSLKEGVSNTQLGLLSSPSQPDSLNSLHIAGISNTTPQVEFQEIKERISTLIPQLYQRLNALCSIEGADRVILDQLIGYQWIWVGDCFVSSDKVAITSAVNAYPYLYTLPQSFEVYSKLLSSFGIKKSFSPRDYIQVYIDTSIRSI